MSITALETEDDMKWLADVHYTEATDFACAILYGNEDSPDKIELFRANHIMSEMVILERDEATGELVKREA